MKDQELYDEKQKQMQAQIETIFEHIEMLEDALGIKALRVHGVLQLAKHRNAQKRFSYERISAANKWAVEQIRILQYKREKDRKQQLGTDD